MGNEVSGEANVPGTGTYNPPPGNVSSVNRQFDDGDRSIAFLDPVLAAAERGAAAYEQRSRQDRRMKLRIPIDNDFQTSLSRFGSSLASTAQTVAKAAKPVVADVKDIIGENTRDLRESLQPSLDRSIQRGHGRTRRVLSSLQSLKAPELIPFANTKENEFVETDSLSQMSEAAFMGNDSDFLTVSSGGTGASNRERNDADKRKSSKEDMLFARSRRRIAEFVSDKIRQRQNPLPSRNGVLFHSEHEAADTDERSLSSIGSPPTGSMDENEPSRLSPQQQPTIDLWDMMPPELQDDSEGAENKNDQTLEVVLESMPFDELRSLKSKDIFDAASNDGVSAGSKRKIRPTYFTVSSDEGASFDASDPAIKRSRRGRRKSIFQPRDCPSLSSIKLSNTDDTGKIRNTDQDFSIETMSRNVSKENLLENDEETTEEFMISEALLIFSSMKNVDLDFPSLAVVPQPMKVVAALRWRQLVANWKHAAMLKMLADRPFSFHLKKSANGNDEEYSHGTESSFSSSSAMDTSNEKLDLCLENGFMNSWFLRLTRNSSGLPPKGVEVPGISSYLLRLSMPSDESKLEEILPIRHMLEGEQRLEGLLSEATKQLPQFTHLVEDVASFASLEWRPILQTGQQTQNVSYSVDIKEKLAIQRKANLKYMGEIFRVADVLRAQMVFPNEQALICGFLRLSKLCEQNKEEDDVSKMDVKIVRIKNLFAEREIYELPTGYRHVLVNVIIDNRLLAEIQFQLLAMFNVMGVEGYSLHRELSDARFSTLPKRKGDVLSRIIDFHIENPSAVNLAVSGLRQAEKARNEAAKAKQDDGSSAQGNAHRPSIFAEAAMKAASLRSVSSRSETDDPHSSTNSTTAPSPLQDGGRAALFAAITQRGRPKSGDESDSGSRRLALLQAISGRSAGVSDEQESSSAKMETGDSTEDCNGGPQTSGAADGGRNALFAQITARRQDGKPATKTCDGGRGALLSEISGRGRAKHAFRKDGSVVNESGMDERSGLLNAIRQHGPSEIDLGATAESANDISGADARSGLLNAIRERGESEEDDVGRARSEIDARSGLLAAIKRRGLSEHVGGESERQDSSMDARSGLLDAIRNRGPSGHTSANTGSEETQLGSRSGLLDPIKQRGTNEPATATDPRSGLLDAIKKRGMNESATSADPRSGPLNAIKNESATQTDSRSGLLDAIKKRATNDSAAPTDPRTGLLDAIKKRGTTVDSPSGQGSINAQQQAPSDPRSGLLDAIKKQGTNESATPTDPRSGLLDAIKNRVTNESAIPTDPRTGLLDAIKKRGTTVVSSSDPRSGLRYAIKKRGRMNESAIPTDARSGLLDAIKKRGTKESATPTDPRSGLLDAIKKRGMNDSPGSHGLSTPQEQQQSETRLGLLDSIKERGANEGSASGMTFGAEQEQSPTDPRSGLLDAIRRRGTNEPASGEALSASRKQPPADPRSGLLDAIRKRQTESAGGVLLETTQRRGPSDPDTDTASDGQDEGHERHDADEPREPETTSQFAAEDYVFEDDIILSLRGGGGDDGLAERSLPPAEGTSHDGTEGDSSLTVNAFGLVMGSDSERSGLSREVTTASVSSAPDPKFFIPGVTGRALSLSDEGAEEAEEGALREEQRGSVDAGGIFIPGITGRARCLSNEEEESDKNRTPDTLENPSRASRDTVGNGTEETPSPHYGSAARAASRRHQTARVDSATDLLSGTPVRRTSSRGSGLSFNDDAMEEEGRPTETASKKKKKRKKEKKRKKRSKYAQVAEDAVASGASSTDSVDFDWSNDQSADSGFVFDAGESLLSGKEVERIDSKQETIHPVSPGGGEASGPRHMQAASRKDLLARSLYTSPLKGDSLEPQADVPHEDASSTPSQPVGDARGDLMAAISSKPKLKIVASTKKRSRHPGLVSETTKAVEGIDAETEGGAQGGDTRNPKSASKNPVGDRNMLSAAIASRRNYGDEGKGDGSTAGAWASEGGDAGRMLLSAITTKSKLKSASKDGGGDKNILLAPIAARRNERDEGASPAEPKLKSASKNGGDARSMLLASIAARRSELDDGEGDSREGAGGSQVGDARGTLLSVITAKPKLKSASKNPEGDRNVLLASIAARRNDREGKGDGSKPASKDLGDDGNMLLASIAARGDYSGVGKGGGSTAVTGDSRGMLLSAITFKPKLKSASKSFGTDRSMLLASISARRNGGDGSTSGGGESQEGDARGMLLSAITSKPKLKSSSTNPGGDRNMLLASIAARRNDGDEGGFQAEPKLKSASKNPAGDRNMLLASIAALRNGGDEAGGGGPTADAGGSQGGDARGMLLSAITSKPKLPTNPESDRNMLLASIAARRNDGDEGGGSTAGAGASDGSDARGMLLSAITGQPKLKSSTNLGGDRSILLASIAARRNDGDEGEGDGSTADAAESPCGDQRGKLLADITSKPKPKSASKNPGGDRSMLLASITARRDDGDEGKEGGSTADADASHSGDARGMLLSAITSNPKLRSSSTNPGGDRNMLLASIAARRDEGEADGSKGAGKSQHGDPRGMLLSSITSKPKLKSSSENPGGDRNMLLASIVARKETRALGRPEPSGIFAAAASNGKERNQSLSDSNSPTMREGEKPGAGSRHRRRKERTSTSEDAALAKEFFVHLISASLNSLAVEARDLAALRCLFLLCDRIPTSETRAKESTNIQAESTTQRSPERKDLTKPQQAALDAFFATGGLETLKENVLLRSLNLANQALSRGMAGWLEYGSSNPLDRNVQRLFEIMQDLACLHARRNCWGVSADIMRSLLDRCEQCLPLYHPMTIYCMIDLHTAIKRSEGSEAHNQLLGRCSRRLALYLCEMEAKISNFSMTDETHVGARVAHKFTKVDCLGMLKAFIKNFEELLKRPFSSLALEDSVQLSHCMIGDSICVLASCMENGIREWERASSFYRRAIKGWARMDKPLWHTSVIGASCGLARCLRETGKIEKGVKVLETIVSNLDRTAKGRLERVETEGEMFVFLPLRRTLKPRICEYRDKAVALCLWNLAVLVVESNRDGERSRIRALSLLHQSAETLRRSLSSGRAPRGEVRVSKKILTCVETEARDLFQPLGQIEVSARTQKGSVRNERLQSQRV